jgi:hypothetical protein
MSNIKILTNRQLALQLAVEVTLKVGHVKDLMGRADHYYEWLQKGPQPDEAPIKFNL